MSAEAALALQPVIVGSDDGTYRADLHPDDGDSLEALIASADIAGVHAILRCRREGEWRLVDHRVIQRRGDGTVVLARTDVTASEQARERAGRDDAYWRAIVRNGSESIAVIEPSRLTIAHASDRLAQLLGIPPDELIGSRAFHHVERQDLSIVRKVIQQLAQAPGPHTVELRLRRPGQGPVWMEAVLSDATDNPAVRGYVVNLREISDRKAAEEQLRSSEQLFRLLVGHLADGALVIDHDHRVTFASKHAAEALGVPVGKLLGNVLPLSLQEDILSLGGTPASNESLPLEMLPADASGPDDRWFRVSAHDLSDDPVAAGWIIVLRDITDGRRRVERLRREVEQDPLTGLLNRRGMENRLNAHLAAGRSVAIGFLDLDGFKAVNDTHGHAVGDALLRGVGASLLRCVRPGDEVARFGGDEFVVAFVDIPAEMPLNTLAIRIGAAARSYPTEAGLVDVQISAGWSLATPDVDAATALDRADRNMYEDKKRVRR